MQNAAKLPRLDTAAAINAETGLPLWLIYQYVRENKIPHVRLGRAVRFDKAAVAEWLRAGGTGYNASDAA